MSDKSPHRVRARIGRLYGIGILVFSAIVGFVTVFVIFLDHLKLS
jgi:hypothetical protein